MLIGDLPADGTAPGDENAIEQLGGLVADNALTLDLVSAFAGDRQLTESEKSFIEDFRKSRGDKFYPDLLYAITHQFFPPSVAENLWNQLLKHKYEMSFTMKRNIRITVAALDYLSNMTGELHSPTVIDETRMTTIIHTSKALISNIDRVPAQENLVSGLVKMCHEAGITTVAEGIERDGEAESCREMGFDLAQGFYFGRPSPTPPGLS